MIQIPSLNILKNSFLNTIGRYKWVTLVVIARVVTLIFFTETRENEEVRNLTIRLSYVFFLAMPLALAITFATGRRQWSKLAKLVTTVLLSGLLILYYFSINSEPNQTDFYRFMLFLAGSHLIVSFAPFVGFDEPNGFWQFNKTLFLQFLNATLYAITLFVGLLIAVETVKFLFNVVFLFEILADLAIVIFTVFHTLFFLSKIPENQADLEHETGYPAGLKIFTQYVLLPLVVIYLIILYAYTGKIIFQWQLPNGGVAYLVLAFSITGILALLLLYPLRENLKERWISLFSHRFYIALLPLIVLLFVGIFRRIKDYGVTENRYLVASLAFWLAGITVYFLFAKRKDIRWIPITLSVICFLLAVGPWNIFSVARSSQINQFQSILLKHKLLNKDNKIDGKATLDKNDYQQLFSITSYFRNRDTLALASYFPKLQTNLHGGKYNYAMDDHLRKHVSQRVTSEINSYTNFSSGLSQSLSVDIVGFNRVLFFSNPSRPTQDGDWKLIAEEDGKKLVVYRKNEKIATFNIAEKETELRQNYGQYSESVPQDALTFDHDVNGIKFKILLKSLSRNDKFYAAEGIFFYK